MAKFIVEVIYQTKAGNEGCKKSCIEADSSSTALHILTEKVRKYKRCLKIVGGNCVEYEAWKNNIFANYKPSPWPNNIFANFKPSPFPAKLTDDEV